jgi:hypothetical protein
MIMLCRFSKKSTSEILKKAIEGKLYQMWLGCGFRCGLNVRTWGVVPCLFFKPVNHVIGEHAPNGTPVFIVSYQDSPLESYFT